MVCRNYAGFGAFALLLLAGCAAPIDPETPLAVAVIGRDAALVSAPSGPARATAPSAPARGSTPAPQAAAPVEAGTEDFIVRPADLTGLWWLYVPRDLGVEVGLFSGVRLRYRRADPVGYVCRFDQRDHAVTGNCLALGGPAQGAIHGNDLTMTWWTGPATLRLDAALTAPGVLTGGFSGGMLGLNLTAHLPAHAERLVAQGQNTPAETALRLALADLARGNLTSDRYTPEAADRLRRRLAAAPLDGGLDSALMSLTYLAPALITRRKLHEDERIEVFDAQFAQGRALCGIALNADGRIADFRWQPE